MIKGISPLIFIRLGLGMSALLGLATFYFIATCETNESLTALSIVTVGNCVASLNTYFSVEK